MRFRLLEEVVLKCDLPEHDLKTGARGTVVHVYEPEDVEVEFVSESGGTTAVVTLPDGDLRRPDGDVRRVVDSGSR